MIYVYAVYADYVVLFLSVLLLMPRTVLCDRPFAVAGPRIWNSLPAGIRDPTLSPGTFATLLKTYLFD